MNRAIRLLLLTILCVMPLLTYAHEGHGVFHADDIRHYLLSSEHAFSIGAMAITLVFILIRMTQQIRKIAKSHQ